MSRSSGGGSSGGVTSGASIKIRSAHTLTSPGKAEVVEAKSEHDDEHDDDAKNDEDQDKDKVNNGDNDGDSDGDVDNGGDNDGDDDARERVDINRESGVNGVAWVQGGAYFVSAGDDGVVRVWSSVDGSHLRTMDDDPLDERDAGGRRAGGGGDRERRGGAEGGDSMRAVAVVGDKLITGGTDEFVKVYQ